MKRGIRVQGAADVRPQSLIANGGVARYEVRRISNARIYKGQLELWVEWNEYDQSHNCWVHRDILTAYVPELVKTFDTRPSTFKARASAPKCATKGYKMPVVKQAPRRRPGLRNGIANWFMYLIS